MSLFMRNVAIKRQFEKGQQMTNENITRALSIIAAEPDESEIAFKGYHLLIAGQSFNTLCEENSDVLQTLMAYKEFGFFVGSMERTALRLRVLL